MIELEEENISPDIDKSMNELEEAVRQRQAEEGKAGKPGKKPKETKPEPKKAAEKPQKIKENPASKKEIKPESPETEIIKQEKKQENPKLKKQKKAKQTKPASFEQKQKMLIDEIKSQFSSLKEIKKLNPFKNVKFKELNPVKKIKEMHPVKKVTESAPVQKIKNINYMMPIKKLEGITIQYGSKIIPKRKEEKPQIKKQEKKQEQQIPQKPHIERIGGPEERYKTIAAKQPKAEKQKEGKKEKAAAEVAKVWNDEERKIIVDEIKKQLSPLKQIREIKLKQKKVSEYVRTEIPGFDDLMPEGIPKGSRVLISGGPGSGKTIFVLQAIYNAVKRGESAIFISLEEEPENLIRHMEDFGWNPMKYIHEGKLIVQRLDPISLQRSVEELLTLAKGELLIEPNPILIPEGFTPQWIGFDSIAALAATFVKGEENYRVYIEQLFKYLDEIDATSLLVSETEEIPKIGIVKGKIEDFLADGIVILYFIRRGNIRQRALEILKMRGAEHAEKVVAIDIRDTEGIVVYPDQEIFGGFE